MECACAQGYCIGLYRSNSVRSLGKILSFEHVSYANKIPHLPVANALHTEVDTAFRTGVPGFRMSLQAV